MVGHSTIEVIILRDGTAKEVNNATNPKMGHRHIAFESMLRTFNINRIEVNADVIYNLPSKDTCLTILTVGKKYQALVYRDAKAIIVFS